MAVNGTETNVEGVMAARCSMTGREKFAAERDERKRESCTGEEEERW
jgi:hypothetical protein